VTELDWLDCVTDEDEVDDEEEDALLDPPATGVGCFDERVNPLTDDPGAGGVVGTAVGVLTGADVGTGVGGTAVAVTRGCVVGADVGAIVGAAVGAVTGALVGALVGAEAGASGASGAGACDSDDSELPPTSVVSTLAALCETSVGRGCTTVWRRDRATVGCATGVAVACGVGAAWGAAGATLTLGAGAPGPMIAGTFTCGTFTTTGSAAVGSS
jgi:hypothetical protein